jgi:hypothetical protein
MRWPNELYRLLSTLFPEDSYGSYASLFKKGYNEGVISIEELEQAKVYYGRLWNYAGD